MYRNHWTIFWRTPNIMEMERAHLKWRIIRQGPINCPSLNKRKTSKKNSFFVCDFSTSSQCRVMQTEGNVFEQLRTISICIIIFSIGFKSGEHYMISTKYLDKKILGIELMESVGKCSMLFKAWNQTTLKNG